MKTEEPTKVMFRWERDGSYKGVLALVPAVAGNRDPSTCSCYAHVGQHSAADYLSVMERSRAATIEEYSNLATELRRIGYNLKIVFRSSRDDYVERCKQVRRTA